MDTNNKRDEEVFNFSNGELVPDENEVSEITNEFAESEEAEVPKKPKKKKSLKRRILKGFLIFMCIFLSLVLVLAGTATIFIFSKLGKITYDTDEPVKINPNQEFVVPDGEEIDFGLIGDAAGNSMKEYLKNWATNDGKKMWDKNVLNFLLIGSDASVYDSNRAHVTDKGNTDAMMVVSIDRKEKTIKMVSFMRDSYTYMDQFDRFAKLNAACANGGPAYLVETIENNFKIEIDGYILVDTDSFVQIIDILGGVRVDVDGYFADYLTNNKDGSFPRGKNVLLNGKQALRYARVRKAHADGDISRVSKQREVIMAIIEKCKGATVGEINAVLDVILANMRTNISQGTIFGYIPTAVAEGWAGYTISELTMPDKYTRYSYVSSETAWIWVIDYPLAAQTTQLFLYGETNIEELPEDRETAISVMGGYVPKKTN